MTCAHCQADEVLVSSCRHGGLCARCVAVLEALTAEVRADDWFERDDFVGGVV